MRRFLWLALLLLMMACTPTTETAVSTPSSPETAVQSTATFPPPVITDASTPAVAATAVPATYLPANAKFRRRASLRKLLFEAERAVKAEDNAKW